MKKAGFENLTAFSEAILFLRKLSCVNSHSVWCGKDAACLPIAYLTPSVVNIPLDQDFIYRKVYQLFENRISAPRANFLIIPFLKMNILNRGVGHVAKLNFLKSNIFFRIYIFGI